MYLPDEYTTVPNACISSWIIGDDRVAFDGDVSTGGIPTEIYCTIELTDCFGDWDSVIYTGGSIITDNDVYHVHTAIEDYGAMPGYCHRFNIIVSNDAGTDTAVFNYVCPTEHAPEVELSVHPDFELECYWEVDFEWDANFDESRFKYLIYTEEGDTLAFDVFDTSPETQSGIQFLINAEEYADMQLFAKIAGKNSLGSDTDYLPFNFWFDDDGSCHMAVWRESDISVSSNILIYPNPANDFVNISGVGESSIVEIANLSGQKIISVSENTIDISTIPSGIYLITVISPGGEVVAIQKLVVQ